jgi:hypothetical protein
MSHFIGQTNNNEPVFVDLINSSAAKRIAQQPYLLTLATEALQNAMLSGVKITVEQDMGRTIGYDYVVETSVDDTVFYAQLVRDSTYTRFIKNGEPLATRHLTMTLIYNEADSCYNLTDLWVGHRRPPRPGSTQENARGNLYWGKHAFVFENQPLQSRTLTKTCPY